MPSVDKDLKDALLHYGVKGMRWGNRKASLDYQTISEENGTGGGGSSEEDELKKTEEELAKLSKQLEEMRSKVGNGPLDMLKNILFGTKKKPTKKESSNSDPSETLKKVSESLKDIKSKIGDGPLDMFRYVITGKRKVQHSALDGRILITSVNSEHREAGRRVLETMLKGRDVE